MNQDWRDAAWWANQARETEKRIRPAMNESTPDWHLRTKVKAISDDSNTFWAYAIMSLLRVL